MTHEAQTAGIRWFRRLALLSGLLIVVLVLLRIGGGRNLLSDTSPQSDSQLAGKEQERDSGAENDPDPAEQLRAMAGMSLDAAQLTPAAYRQHAADFSATERKVLAFYYAWFSTPGGPGGRDEWRHWTHGNGPPGDGRLSISSRYPLLGPYDSHDPKLIDRHCRWAAEAGIDGWILSWWGRSSEAEYEDRSVLKVLDGCQAQQRTACLHYESFVEPTTSPQAVADEIVWALEHYGKHPAYLKVAGRPVMFIYARAIDIMGLAQWRRVLALVRERHSPGAVFLGDRFSPAAARVFDGLYTYNPAPALVGMEPEAARAWAASVDPQWVGLARRAGRISTLTVLPGYDDTPIRPKGFRVQRHDGELYRAQWEQATAADPHWVLITTFNEWSEGSEIEPSTQSGRKYLDSTRDHARRFKTMPPRDASAELPSPWKGKDLDDLRQRLGQRKMAALPGADSEAIWWLINDVKLAPDLLSWQDVAEGRLAAGRYDILLHAGNEYYCQTWQQTEDVDEALKSYLHSGGCLVALPWKPVPLFYNEKGKGVNGGEKLGLHLLVPWDKSPAGAALSIHRPPGVLPHVPEKLAFPCWGDQGWRPLSDKHCRRFVPLLELRDQEGRSQGAAAAYAELRDGGRIVYAWFRLLDDPHAHALLLDLFDLAADPSKLPPPTAP